MRPMLLRVARRVTRDDDAAADVVQRAFLKALLHAAQFEGRAALRTWVHRIVVNESLQWCRARARSGRAVEALACLARLVPPPGPPSPFEALERRETTDRLRAALAQLRPGDRWLIERSLSSDDTTIGDLAAASGIRVRALRTRLHRARRRLRRALEASP